jgi:pyruvate/2-oxoglutarate dehydrogenase complex dihydrolipoamide acyltransferase (E2) component
LFSVKKGRLRPLLRTGVHEGRIEVREYLPVTLAFDHDAVDGPLAARFARRFVELVETAAVMEGAPGVIGF